MPAFSFFTCLLIHLFFGICCLHDSFLKRRHEGGHHSCCSLMGSEAGGDGKTCCCDGHMLPWTRCQSIWAPFSFLKGFSWSGVLPVGIPCPLGSSCLCPTPTQHPRPWCARQGRAVSSPDPRGPCLRAIHSWSCGGPVWVSTDCSFQTSAGFAYHLTTDIKSGEEKEGQTDHSRILQNVILK